jgi:hypothetical protein
MNSKEVENCERTRLELFLNKVQLPQKYKSIGIVMVTLSFMAISIFKFINDEPLWIGPGLKHAMLLGLLIISLSREKIEDEMIETLRSKSYALAFIIGVGYSMLQPLANYFIDLILGEDDFSSNIGYAQVLLFMLLIQVGFFELLKRTR